MDIGDKVVVDVVEMMRDDRTEQQSAETGSRVDRQDQFAERNTPRRGDRARVPHLQLGQQHDTNDIGLARDTFERYPTERLTGQLARVGSA